MLPVYHSVADRLLTPAPALVYTGRFSLHTNGNKFPLRLAQTNTQLRLGQRSRERLQYLATARGYCKRAAEQVALKLVASARSHVNSHASTLTAIHPVSPGQSVYLSVCLFVCSSVRSLLCLFALTGPSVYHYFAQIARLPQLAAAAALLLVALVSSCRL